MKTRGRPRHPDVLTPREWEVLTLVRESLTNAQIAERLGITLDAAKYHVSEILSKLHLGSREEAAAWQPEPAQAAVLRPSWANALGHWWPSFARIAGAGAMVAAVAGIGLLAYGVLKNESEDEANSVTAAEETTSPSEEELLNRFLAARVAGGGAEQYLGDPQEDLPLLYATTSGASYDRAEFERVPGIEWPYGNTAFKVRLFAGETVVEQLVFIGPDGPLEVGYMGDGFGTDIAPTTEDGQPVAAPHETFDGEVTVHIAHPWVSFYGRGTIQLVPEGMGPTTDGGQRHGWNHLVLMADPARFGRDCPIGPGPTDAEALAESIRSDPDLAATAPVVVGARGAEGLMMDVVSTAGANADCGGLAGDGNLLARENVSLATGGRVRLYLFDAPEGSSMRTLAIAIKVPESRWQTAVDAAAAVSVEFHAP
jgi:DNA-binding CsgD family transcriptional regulator